MGGALAGGAVLSVGGRSGVVERMAASGGNVVSGMAGVGYV